jgi:WD40 repeat protein
MTSSSHQTLERIARRVPVPEPAYERLLRRRDRKERNRRLSTGALAIILTLVSFVALTRVLRTAEGPASEPTPKPPGIFSEVGGWIAYGWSLSENCEPSPCVTEVKGIWAVDPTRPDDPISQIQLSTDRGIPLAWSSDGSKLLILRTHNAPLQASLGSNLFVLNADGTETRLTEGDAWITGGSFSPDGSKVVYATPYDEPSRIFVVDAAGGTPHVLLTGGQPTSYGLDTPTFSPDGSKIAYFAWDREDLRLRVMNADGSGSRVLGHVVFKDTGNTLGLVWSPDGTLLAIDYGGDIYTVRADGSDLTLVIPHGGSPNWSPDGSHIAYDFEDVSYPPGPHLEIADADGKNTQEFGNAGSGPWNPLVQPEPEVAEVSSVSEGLTLTSTPIPVVALMAPVVGAFLIRRPGPRRGVGCVTGSIYRAEAGGWKA